MSYFIKLIFTLVVFTPTTIVHASNTKAGLPQLDLETYPSLMFWTVISLIIGYVFMKYVVTPNIKAILNLRETSIQNDLVKAKATSQENQKIKQEIIDNQQQIKLKSQKIINDALYQSKIIVDKAENDITPKIDAKIIKAENRIKQLQDNVINEIISNADEVITKIVNKFTNINYDKKYMKKSIKLASKNILTEK